MLANALADGRRISRQGGRGGWLVRVVHAVRRRLVLLAPALDPCGRRRGARRDWNGPQIELGQRPVSRRRLRRSLGAHVQRAVRRRWSCRATGSREQGTSVARPADGQMCHECAGWSLHIRGSKMYAPASACLFVIFVCSLGRSVGWPVGRVVGLLARQVAQLASDGGARQGGEPHSPASLVGRNPATHLT